MIVLRQNSTRKIFPRQKKLFNYQRFNRHLDALNNGVIDGKKVFDLVTEATATIGEKISIRRFVTYQTQGKLTTYIHMGGKIGVLVEMTGGTDELGKDVAMQIAASNPSAVDRAGVDASELEHEKEIILGGEKVLRFTRYQLGEGIEKKETDFAAEVAAQAGMTTK